MQSPNRTTDTFHIIMECVRNQYDRPEFKLKYNLINNNLGFRNSMAQTKILNWQNYCTT